MESLLNRTQNTIIYCFTPYKSKPYQFRECSAPFIAAGLLVLLVLLVALSCILYKIIDSGISYIKDRYCSNNLEQQDGNPHTAVNSARYQEYSPVAQGSYIRR